MTPPSRKVLACVIGVEETLPLLLPNAVVSPAREMLGSMAVCQRLLPHRPARGRLQCDFPRLDRPLLVSSLPTTPAEWRVTTRSEVCA